MLFTSPNGKKEANPVVVGINGRRVIVTDSRTHFRNVIVRQKLIDAGWLIEEVRDGRSFAVYHDSATESSLLCVAKEIENAFGTEEE